MEEWKSVEDNSDYEISTLGRLRNRVTGNLRTLFGGAGGYMRAMIPINGKQTNIRAHQLVARAFIPNPNGYRVVHHRDHNRSNNVVSNLEWTTHSQNTIYAIKSGSFKPPGSEARMLQHIKKLQSEHNFILVQEMVEYLQTKSVLSAL